MKSRISFAAVSALVLAVALALAGTALAGTVASSKKSPFTASYAGRAVVRATGDTTADLSVRGAGTGNVVGKSTITGVGKGFQGDPCSAFTGTGSIVSKLGRLNFTLNPGAKACPSADNPDVSAITASVKITGGTAKLKTARGTLKLTGTYDRGTGKFASTFKGVISM